MVRSAKLASGRRDRPRSRHAFHVSFRALFATFAVQAAHPHGNAHHSNDSRNSTDCGAHNEPDAHASATRVDVTRWRQGRWRRCRWRGWGR